MAASAAGCGGLEQEEAPPAPLLPGEPFTLGVASGDPLADGVVLWTRLAPEPLDGGGMPDERVPVIWEVSRREDFYSIEQFGWVWATPELGHSVHVEASGLEPDTWYYYRFRVGGEWVSPVGRTRTFPRRGDSPERLRLATASCQNWTHGYYNAYAYLAKEEIDLVAFLGDYIYESGVHGEVRDHNSSRPQSLDGFRNRYALYKSDAHLQAAHRQCPWILTWDDHEVKNNYANLHIDGVADDEARALRAAAYQAYYEHMPLRLPLPGEPADLQIYRRLQYGDLVSFHVLDGRQYRSDQACDDQAGPACDAVDDPERTMLGETQRQWLVDGLRHASTRWNGIVQQTVFASTNLGGAVVNPDQWDGYAAERRELLAVFAEEGVENVVVHTGDIHTAIFATLHEEANDYDSPVVGVEAVTTAISSNGLAESSLPADLVERALDRQPNVHYFNANLRGYCVCEYTPQTFSVEYRMVSTVKEPAADVSTPVSFTVHAHTLDIDETRE